MIEAIARRMPSVPKVIVRIASMVEEVDGEGRIGISGDGLASSVARGVDVGDWFRRAVTEAKVDAAGHNELEQAYGLLLVV